MTIHRLQHLNNSSSTMEKSVMPFYLGCLSMVGILAIMNIGLSVTTMYNRVASNNSATPHSQELSADIQSLQTQIADKSSLQAIKQQAAAQGYQNLDPSTVSYWAVPNTNAVANKF